MITSKLDPRKTVRRNRAHLIWPVLMLALAVVAPSMAPAAGTASAPEQALLENKPWFGDFDQMAAKRQIRVLVVYSKTFYFLDRGR